MRVRELGRSYGEFQVTNEDVIRSIRNPVVIHSITQLVSMVGRKPYLVSASNPEVAQLVNIVIDRHWSRLVLYSAQALIWGHAPMEVVWKLTDVYLPNGKILPAVTVPERFIFVPSYKVRYLLDEETGEIVGFRYTGKDGKKVDVLKEKCLRIAHWEELVDSPYGLPIVALTKPFEEMFADILELLGVWVENQASPPVLGRAPLQQIELENGSRISAAEYMAQKLMELRANGFAVIPSEMEQGGQPLWGVEAPLRFSESASISQAIEVLLQLTRIGILGLGGTMVAGHAQAVPAEDLVASHFFHEIMNALNSQLIRYVVYLNWGEEEWASMISAESGSVDIDLIRDLVRASIQFFPEAREKLFGAVDWDALFDMLGLPTTSKEEETELEKAVASVVEPNLPAAPAVPAAAPGLAGLFGLPGVELPQAEAEAKPEEFDVEKILREAGLRSGESAAAAEGSAPPEGEGT